jgi:hypothetical protein
MLKNMRSENFGVQLCMCDGDQVKLKRAGAATLRKRLVDRA